MSSGVANTSIRRQEAPWKPGKTQYKKQQQQQKNQWQPCKLL